MVFREYLHSYGKYLARGSVIGLDFQLIKRNSSAVFNGVYRNNNPHKSFGFSIAHSAGHIAEVSYFGTSHSNEHQDEVNTSTAGMMLNGNGLATYTGRAKTKLGILLITLADPKLKANEEYITAMKSRAGFGDQEPVVTYNSFNQRYLRGFSTSRIIIPYAHPRYCKKK